MLDTEGFVFVPVLGLVWWVACGRPLICIASPPGVRVIRTHYRFYVKLLMIKLYFNGEPILNQNLWFLLHQFLSTSEFVRRQIRLITSN